MSTFSFTYSDSKTGWGSLNTKLSKGVHISRKARKKMAAGEASTWQSKRGAGEDSCARNSLTRAALPLPRAGWTFSRFSLCHSWAALVISYKLGRHLNELCLSFSCLSTHSPPFCSLLTVAVREGIRKQILQGFSILCKSKKTRQGAWCSIWWGGSHQTAAQGDRSSAPVCCEAAPKCSLEGFTAFLWLRGQPTYRHCWAKHCSSSCCTNSSLQGAAELQLMVQKCT